MSTEDVEFGAIRNYVYECSIPLQRVCIIIPNENTNTFTYVRASHYDRINCFKGLSMCTYMVLRVCMWRVTHIPIAFLTFSFNPLMDFSNKRTGLSLLDID